MKNVGLLPYQMATVKAIRTVIWHTWKTRSPSPLASSRQNVRGPLHGRRFISRNGSRSSTINDSLFTMIKLPWRTSPIVKTQFEVSLFHKSWPWSKFQFSFREMVKLWRLLEYDNISIQYDKISQNFILLLLDVCLFGFLEHSALRLLDAFE